MQLSSFHRAFPSPHLLVPYSEGLRFVQIALRSFPHGGLKEWATTRKPAINYSMLVTLKNNKLRKPAPLLVQRILKEFDFPAELIGTDGVDNERHYKFVFPNQELLDLFNSQLAQHDNSTNNPEGA